MSGDAVDVKREPKPNSIAEFLENVPPSTTIEIPDLAVVSIYGNNQAECLKTPEILIHCPNNKCNGSRIFRHNSENKIFLKEKEWKYIYITYLCSNCQTSGKTFSIAVFLNEKGKREGKCYKFGELPPFGPPTPSRLISLAGPDRDIFLKGRRSELQGLGIGAFVYYRRMIENQKDRIIDEIIKVAEKVAAPSTVIDALIAAKAETQFSKALKSVEVPQSLLISGQNPLSLLHIALSDGLHAKTDEHCLELANSVRVVLSELSERIGQTLKDEAELKHAISVLVAKKNSKSSK